MLLLLYRKILQTTSLRDDTVGKVGCTFVGLHTATTLSKAGYRPIATASLLDDDFPTVQVVYTPWSMKTCHFYYLNCLVKHWPILIIFGT